MENIIIILSIVIGLLMIGLIVTAWVIEKLKTIYISLAAKILLSNLSPNLSAY